MTTNILHAYNLNNYFIIIIVNIIPCEISLSSATPRWDFSQFVRPDLELSIAQSVLTF